MAIERSSKNKFRSGKSKPKGMSGGLRVLLFILIVIPIVFYFIKPETRNSFVNYQMGRAYERFSNYSEAKRYYSKAFDASAKKDFRAHMKYAEMSNKLGQYSEAINVTTRLIDAKPTDEILLAEIYRQQGLGFEGLESNEDALVSYMKGAKLDAENYFVLIALGRIYRIRGEWTKSQQYLEDAINLRQLRSPEAHYELGLTYLARGAKADALDEFDYVLRQLPSRELRTKAQQQKIDIMANEK